MNAIPTLDIFIFFLALVPGYLSVKSAQAAGNITTPMSRFEKTIWSFIGSGISIFVLFSLYLLFASLRDGYVHLPNLAIDLEVAILVFPLLVAISLIVGLITGKVVQRLDFVKLSRDIPEPTWDYIAHKITEIDEPIEVRVNTDGGEEIRGYVGAIGTTNDNRDLLLVYPERLQRIGGEIDSRISDGEFFYIREDAISSVSFDVDVDALQLPGDSDE
jgi:hypothetical protein